MRLMLDDRYETMPWDEIDAVVFDVGNVLLSWKADLILNDYVPEVSHLHDELARRIFHSPYWTMRDRGIITVEEAIEGMSSGAPELTLYIRRVMTEWVAMDRVIEEGIQALKTCKAHGKRLYVLSNYAADAFQVVDEKYEFFRLFDGKLISGREQLVKPEPAIYQLAAQRFQLDPARTLFIDDTHTNIEAALFAGWQGICYNCAGKLTRFFA